MIYKIIILPSRSKYDVFKEPPLSRGLAPAPIFKCNYFPFLDIYTLEQKKSNISLPYLPNTLFPKCWDSLSSGSVKYSRRTETVLFDIVCKRNYFISL